MHTANMGRGGTEGGRERGRENKDLKFAWERFCKVADLCLIVLNRRQGAEGFRREK